MLLLPTTTHSFHQFRHQNVLITGSLRLVCMVRNPFSPITIFPTLTGWNPSTSFLGSIANNTSSSSICFGSGSCTRIPLISGSNAYLRSPLILPVLSLLEAHSLQTRFLYTRRHVFYCDINT